MDIQINTRGIREGSIVRHFKHERCGSDAMYIYRVLGFAMHTETKETLVVYQALYENEATGVHYDMYCRPAEMFFSEVDQVKYPGYKQKYRFELIR